MSRTLRGKDRKAKRAAYAPRCGRTRKIGFRSQSAALQRGAEIATSPQSHVERFRAYHCAYCGQWHLTGENKNN